MNKFVVIGYEQCAIVFITVAVGHDGDEKADCMAFDRGIWVSGHVGTKLNIYMGIHRAMVYLRSQRRPMHISILKTTSLYSSGMFTSEASDKTRVSPFPITKNFQAPGSSC